LPGVTDETSSIRGNRLRTLMVAIAVATAFADSSIVVLGLPEMFSSFEGATPVKLALVVMAYNAVVAVVGLLVYPRIRRPRPGAFARVGTIIFTASAVGCGVVGTLWGLIAIRAVQGLGAGLLLVSSLALLVGLAGSRGRGASLWSAAGTFGAAFGPALGGILTQFFGWEGIFFGMAVVLGVAFFALLGARGADTEAGAERPAPRSAALSVGEVLVFGALVATLFLAVTMIITGWGHDPIVGAAIVTVLPVLTIAAGWLAARLPGPTGALAGAILLGLGLLGLAFLSDVSIWMAMVALAVCGVGVGLTVPYLTDTALKDDMGARNVARTIGWRHVGVVVGLAVVGPVLFLSIEKHVDDYPAVAVAGVLGAPIPIQDKITIAGNVADAYKDVNDGETPDISTLTAGLSQDDVDAVEDSVLESVEPAVTRTLRWPYLAAAILAFLLVVPLLRMRRTAGAQDRPGRTGLIALAAAGVVAVGLLVYEFADGAASFGSGGITEACSAEPTYPGSGIAAEAQQVIEEALFDTACALAAPITDVVEALSGAPSLSELKAEAQSTFQQELASLTSGLPQPLTNAIDQALAGTPLAVGS
jgi:MFS family permease